MEKKISKWLKDGLINDETAFKMIEEIKADKAKATKTRVNITIYTVAVILIGLGIITFISANDWILELLNSCELLKIFLISLATFGAFIGGYQLAYEKQNFPKLGNALIFLSTLLIGGTYALIGQIYHINANSSFLMFLWLVSILPVAFLFKSRAVNILSIIIMIFSVIFFYEELSLDDGLLWTIFIPVISGIILYSAGNIPVVLNKFNDFSLSYKIVGALPVFITFLVLTCSVEHSYHITSWYYFLPVIILLLLNLVNYMIQKNCSMLFKLETASMIIILCMLLLLLILPEVSTLSVVIIANIFIIAMITFGFNYGYKFENGKIIGITNWMLTIYLTVNYCRWGWSFIDKSLFFTLGGSFLLALGLFLEKRRKEVTGKKE